MRLPTDLTHEIADRVEPPGFDAVLTRARAARRRRRRTSIASGLAAACVVGGLAFAVGDPLGSDDNSPQPAPPGPTYDGSSEVDSRLPAEVQEFLAGDFTEAAAALGSSDGTAAVWVSCPVNANACEAALVTRQGDQLEGRLLTRHWVINQPVPGGWLIWDGKDGWVRATPTGETEPIYVAGPGNSDVMAGDTAIETSDGWRLLRGDKIIPIPSPSGRTVLGAYVTPDGRLIAATTSGHGVSISATDDGRTWEYQMSARTTVQISTAVVAGNGDHVAVAFLGDDPDGSIPLREVQYSHDAGATWEWARGLDVEGADAIHNLSSLAVSAEGSTYLTTESHGLIRVDTYGNAMASGTSSHDRSLFATGDGVCLVAETGRVDELRCSADDGTTWTPLSLPGFR